MNVQLIVQFIATMILIIGSFAAGNWVGKVLEAHEKNEKEELISVISGALLGLLSFMLAFTFGIVSDRYYARKSLVREEANQIGTVWLRTDFMPEPDRFTARQLLKEYLNIRVGIYPSYDDEEINHALANAEKIHDRLWTLGNSHAEMRSDVGALYFDALNKLIDLHRLRVAIGYRESIPSGIWIALYILLVLGMLSIGYYAAVIESKRSMGFVIMAFSFSLVIGIISSLDAFQANQFKISHQPFIDLQAKIANQ